MWENIKEWYKQLPDKKKYVEFISALLTVPVLITVILVNLNNLSQKNAAKQQADSITPAVTKIVETLQPINIMQANDTGSASSAPVITNTPADCKKQVGPVDIASPRENEIIRDTSVCLEIAYQQGEYCGIVWSYALDNSGWSNFSDKEVCLFNLSSGTHELSVRVKSTASSNEILLKRSFVYNGPTPSLAPTQSATDGATIK